jgi:hypothetical protein
MISTDVSLHSQAVAALRDRSPQGRKGRKDTQGSILERFMLCESWRSSRLCGSFPDVLKPYLRETPGFIIEVEKRNGRQGQEG